MSTGTEGPVLAVDDRDICPVAWSGCDSYTGGHLCNRDHDHKGKHRCDCGAEKRRYPDDDQFCGCCGVNSTSNNFCSACSTHLLGGEQPWNRANPNCPVAARETTT